MNMKDRDIRTQGDALDEYVSKVSDLHSHLARIADSQQAICPELQRMANALRDLSAAVGR